MPYVIKPVDNLFFRSSVPFEAGGETVGVKGIFPPLPSVYAGAFRPLYNASEAGGQRLKIGMNGLWLDEGYYFPAPLDMQRLEVRRGEDWLLRPMGLKKRPLSNYPLDYFLHTASQAAGKSKEKKNLYLSEQDLSCYLNGCVNQVAAKDMDDGYIISESKIGIEVERGSGTSKNQQMYQVVSVRPAKGLKLAVDVSGVNVNDRQLIKLGGEGKTALVRNGQHQLAIQVSKKEESRFFKLYLATPAIFKNGWLPGWIDKAGMTGRFSYRKKSVKVRLISACVGRRVPCGGFGFDREAGQYRPKELRFAVPAGSVYYFELLQGTIEEAAALFDRKTISDYREGLGFDYKVFDRSRYCDRGFGYALVGALSEEQEEVIDVR
ncbi:type III-B CRISPR module-associated protein Cmr3 [Bacilliculturomica massiliensis]|uniref:type III-B CRISPR module-associated protein Cmr3 n=1 Tax=Bacilliculturomica massiliensis TaxID=1917867 RepID=UPI00102FCDBF|nr:type III-B CRISPR module-associated protein Cmr3 [Bacilliculturomica massiliensis]